MKRVSSTKLKEVMVLFVNKCFIFPNPSGNDVMVGRFRGYEFGHFTHEFFVVPAQTTADVAG